MDIRITLKMFEANEAGFKKFGILKEHFGWAARSKVPAVHLPTARFAAGKIVALVETLNDTLKKMPTSKDVKVAIKDAQFILRVINEDDIEIKNLRLAPVAFRDLLSKVPGHRVFKGDDEERMDCYYVEDVTYHPAESGKGWHTPARVFMKLVYHEKTETRSESIIFMDHDCVGITATEALRRKGIFTETPELRARYLAMRDVFVETVDNVGLQLILTGSAYLTESSKWSREKFDLVASKCVVDGFDAPQKKKVVAIDSRFWDSSLSIVKKNDGNLVIEEIIEDDDDEIEVDEDEEPAKASDAHLVKEDLEIPVHPTIRVFDLTKHTYFHADIRNTKPYEYDETMAEKLVLPAETKSLIDMLCAHDGSFRDIVKRKGGGATILCAGPPGVGKTLTAEVYAESMKRPLYSVQCSQLGLNASSLEKSLLECFSRAEKWNAILLLDEADVYIAERARDMNQNAIVGVFLRVLEYYAGILFMTTNRADIVDDAIMSRCLARIEYKIPPVDDQLRIWTILADVMGVPLTERTKKQIVANGWTTCSGRDIKNTLRLAQLVAKAKGESEPSMTTLKFCFQFRT